MMKKIYTAIVCSVLFLFCLSTAQAQQRAITGVVADQQGLTLPGVTVNLKGTQVSTTTNTKGQFSIKVPPGNVTLVFSFVGMETNEMPVKAGQTNLSVALRNNPQALNEVVVVGYGTQKKADLTGSVASIKGSDLIKTPSASVDQLLEGTMAGVQVITSSGQPGAGAQIVIRGQGTINSDGNPLVVVDGIEYGDAGNLKQVNPDDIATIDVLKDASATAIYGSRGANGVIMITTKKGVPGQARITFSSLTTLSELENKLDVWEDPVEEATIENQANINGGVVPLFTGQYYGGIYYPSLDQLRGLATLPAGQKLYNTNWENLVFRKPISQNYTISANGGDDKTRYAISANYFDNQGLNIDNGYKKYTGHINIDQKVKPNVTVGANITITNTYNYGEQLSANRSIIFPAYNPDGTYFHIGTTDYYNPLQIANTELNTSKTIDLLASGYLSWDIIKGLNFKSQFSYTYGNALNDNYQPIGVDTYGAQFSGFGQVYNYNDYHIISDNYLTYDRDFGTKHHINIVAGYTSENNTIRQSTLQGEGFVNDVLQDQDLNGATTVVIPPSPANGETKTVLESGIFRANYSFMNRYLFTFTSRLDGSSVFAVNNKTAFFPSGAFAWKVNDEPFMKSLPQVSELKVRASYGVTGNQGIAPYQSLATLGSYQYFTGTPGNTSFQTGYGPPFYYDGSNVNGKVFDGLANNSLKWETTSQLDIGFDLGLLNQRFTLTADYYDKKTTNLLRSEPIALSSGFTVIEVNDGSIANKGLELTGNAAILQGKLKWNVGANISFNRNKVISVGGGDDFVTSEGEIEAIRAPLNYYIDGQPANVFLGYKFGGIVQQPGGTNPVDGTAAQVGDIKYIAGGPIPTGPAPSGEYIIGNPNPKFDYGFNTSLSYAHFDLYVQLNGVYGNDIFNFNKFGPAEELQAWTPDNPNNLYPAVNSVRVYYSSAWYVESGSYLRIQNVNLGYTLPPNLIKGISNLRVFLSGSNLYTFDKIGPSFDPEVGSNGQATGQYLKPRQYSLGLNVNF
jgi:TonB-dependent starch-binding outer membrane protein SusC